MAPGDDRRKDPPALEQLREVVPARAVLTELARGFLLAQQSNPDRALQFATTFLRECSGANSATPTEPRRPAPAGRRRWRTEDRGPVEPSNFPPRR